MADSESGGGWGGGGVGLGLDSQPIFPRLGRLTTQTDSVSLISPQNGGLII